VHGGTVNLNGAIVIRVNAEVGQSALSRIAHLVAQAQDPKPLAAAGRPYFRRVLPSILGIAALTGAVWFLAKGAGPVEAMMTAIAVLVIACPCALGLATPRR